MLVRCLQKGLLLLCAVFAIAAPLSGSVSAAHFAGGSGTADDPYIITDHQQLYNIRHEPNAVYSVLNDIHIPDEAYCTGGIFSQGWVAADFGGVLNGNGFRIENLQLQDTSGYAGLFALNCGTISNLTIAASSLTVRGDSATAGYFSAVNEGSIHSCTAVENAFSFSGAAGGDYKLGGIAGENFGCIENATNRTEVICAQIEGVFAAIGGIAGVNVGRIDQCRNLADISVTTGSGLRQLASGGIVGADFGGILLRSYNKASVTVEVPGGSLVPCVGGFVGRTQTCTVKDCFSAGNVCVNADNSYTGGFVGLCEGGEISTSYCANCPGSEFFGDASEWDVTVFRDCFYMQDQIRDDRDNGTEAKTREEMELQNTYTGYDFTAVWRFDTDGLYRYPCLQAVEMVYSLADVCAGQGHQYGAFVENNDATETSCGTRSAVCVRCGAVYTEEIPDSYLKKQGWRMEYGNWRYYVDGVALSNVWALDSVGWVYLDNDGNMLRNGWCRDSYGWCYVGLDGYMVKDCWQRDSFDWCYIGSDGYMVTNQWVLDCGWWVYMEHSGYKARNRWVQTAGRWYYLDEYGLMVVCRWLKDSYGWVYLGQDGAMLTDSWCLDGQGWCYVGADGYALKNCWKEASLGWVHFNGEGSMMKACWIYEYGYWYYMDSAGYMLSDTHRYIEGKVYYFAPNGICQNPY